MVPTSNHLVKLTFGLLLAVFVMSSASATPVLFGIDTGFGSGGGGGGSGGGGSGTGGGGISALVTLDQTTGAVTFIGESLFGGGLSALGSDPANGRLFSATPGREADHPGNVSRLITINPNTGHGNLVGPTGIELTPPGGGFDQFGNQRQAVSDLSVNASGTLFGIAARGSQLGTFNTTTGAATKVGDTVCSGSFCASGNALAFEDPVFGGDLFFAHESGGGSFVTTLDPSDGTTGVNVTIDFSDLDTKFGGPQTTRDYRIGGMAFDPVDNDLFVAVLDSAPNQPPAANGILAKLDPVTGIVTGIAQTGLKLEGLAFIDDSQFVTSADDLVALQINTEHSRVVRGPNLSAFGTGDFLAFSVGAVTPNPLDGLGGENTNVVGTQNGVTRQLFFFEDPAIPGEYFRQVPYSDGTGGGNDLTGSWELTITNAGSSNSPIMLNTAVVGDAPAISFATDISITPDGLTPTFNWVLPSDGTVIDEVSVFITDLNVRTTPGSAAVIFSETLTGTATSFTAPTLLGNGSSLEFGGKYEVVVNVRQTRPDGSTLTRTGTHAAFSPLDVDTGGVEVFIPTVDPTTGQFNFDIAIAAGFPVILDPDVAVGYDYAIGAGDPNFASVLVLTDVVPGIYELLIPDPTNTNAFFSQQLLPGQLFSFNDFLSLQSLPPIGVESFTIQGISPNVGLDPTDATAFLTQVTFVDDPTNLNPRFTGTMTPLVANVATAEPSTWMLMALGLMGIGVSRRSTGRRAAT